MADNEMKGDALVAPAVARNRDAILAVLKRVLPETGLLLEIASGSGEHAVYFAGALPRLTWQPSDPDAAARASIAAHARAAGLPNLLPVIEIDASAPPWPMARADALLAINMIHIAPWAATLGLMQGAGAILTPGAPLALYGPYLEANTPTAPTNLAFDADLKRRDPAWGLRDRAAVVAAAEANGLHLAERVAMPANNLILVFRREPADQA
jgi:SAM-dependent methyltransferase